MPSMLPQITVIQPIEDEEIHIQDSGECFEVSVNDAFECFKINVFDESCFYINYDGLGITQDDPPLLSITDLPINFTGVHTQGTKLLILENSTTIHSYIMSYDKVNNVIWATGKSTHTLTGLTTPIVSDIYSQNNIKSTAPVFIGNSSAQLGAYGHWVDSLIFSAKTGVIGEREFIGDVGELRDVIGGSNPSCNSTVIAVDPVGSVYDNLYNFIHDATWLKHLSDPTYQQCLGSRVIYKYLGNYYWHPTEFPVQPTMDTAISYQLVTAGLTHYFSYNGELVAGWGYENDEIGGEDRICIEIGGDLGYQTYYHWQKKFTDGEWKMVTLTYEFTGWKTRSRIVFDNAIPAISLEDRIDWYISETHIAFIGNIKRPNLSQEFGLHYCKYDDAEDGRTVQSLKTINIDGISMNDQTLYNDIFLYAEPVSGQNEATLKMIKLV